MDHSKYLLQGEWTTDLKKKTQKFLGDKWNEMENEEADPDFVEYILVCFLSNIVS